VPVQLVQVRATVDLVVPVPRGWTSDLIAAYCALDHWQQAAHWRELHPRLCRPVSLTYVAPAAPAAPPVDRAR
jgi:hypothetical protein